MVEIKIYTKEYCAFCHKAKLLLDSLNLKYNEIKVSSQTDMENLFEKTQMMTVPQIFFDDKLIGGCDDLFSLKDNGKLEKIIS